MLVTLPLLGLAIVVFASTNIDDIFVLLGFFADPKFRPSQVIVGQYLGIGVLFLIGLAGSLVSLVLRPEYIGLLGLLPILIGAKKLYDAMRETDESEESLERHGSTAGVAAVAAVTIANGGDNIGVYTPLFASRTLVEVSIIGLIFIVMTALWLCIAHWLVAHRTLGAPIRRYGHRVVPCVLIALGIFIMFEAGSLNLICAS